VNYVITGLDPVIHVFVRRKNRARKSWMRGSSPRMTVFVLRLQVGSLALHGHLIGADHRIGVPR